jgi:cytochrome c oxidase cbb3-type subunit 3
VTRGMRVALAATVLIACEREARPFGDSPPAHSVSPQSSLQPGPTLTTDTGAVASAPGGPTAAQYAAGDRGRGRYDSNAWGANEGKRLFTQMNCSGCHSNGGGGIGPALMDDEWLYGSEPNSLYETIVSGRPNGMPAFKDRLTAQQVWQLVSYVRSLSALTPKGARPSRLDHMMVKPAEMQTPNGRPRVVRPASAAPSP